MQKTNEVTLTGAFTLTQITDTFQKQSIVFASKDREGVWKDGDFECYIKPDVLLQHGVVHGDTVKAKGFMVFSFFTKADGTQMSFPKLIVQEILEVEKAGAQPQQGYAQPQAQPAQPTQPQAMLNTGAPVQPPMPGGAPTAPMAPAPGVPPTPAY